MIMNTLLNLFLLSTIICFIIDISGFFTFVKKFVASRIEGKYKNLKYEDIKIPFVTCSLCTVWWTGIIYLLCIREFTIINFAFVAFLALVSSNISGLLLTFKDYLATFENWLQKLIKK